MRTVFRDRIPPAAAAEYRGGSQGVLREAVVYALVHRDYRPAANVQIYIFEDRVEQVGSGIRHIREICKDYDTPELRFKILDEPYKRRMKPPSSSRKRPYAIYV